MDFLKIIGNLIKYPDISIIELEKLANNIVSIKYEDNVYELDMKFSYKIKILNDERNKIEEIEMLEEIKNNKQIQIFNNNDKNYFDVDNYY